MSTPKIHHVTSRGRPAGQSSTSFTYPLWVPRDHNRITLLAAQVPKTYYLIDEGYNSFTWTPSVGVPVTYYIPAGNYTFNTFATMWNSVCTASGLTIETSGTDPAAPHSAPTFNTLSDGRFRLSGSASGTISFPANSQLPLILGFSAPITITAGAYTTSTQVVDFTATSQIYITCDKAVGVAAGSEEKGGMLSHFFVNQIPDLSFVTFTNPAPIDTATVFENEATVDPTPRQVFANFSIIGDGYAALDLHGHDVDIVIMTWCEHDYWTLLKYYVQAQALQMQMQLEKQ